MPIMLRPDDKAKQIADSLVGYIHLKNTTPDKRKKYQKKIEFEETRSV